MLHGHATSPGTVVHSAAMQGGVLEQQQVEGAWDILGKEATRKAYDKDAKEQAASAKASVEARDSQSTAEVALSGLATADTGHLSLDDLKESAAKVWCHVEPATAAAWRSLPGIECCSGCSQLWHVQATHSC